MTKPTLMSLESHGSQCSARTGWQTWPGFTMAKLSDGSSKYLSALCAGDALAELAKDGIDTTEYVRKCRVAEIRNGYPPKPEGVELYQAPGYGYEKPVELGAWQWSTSFGRWGRIVRFACGWHGFTYPKDGRAISEKLRADALAELGETC